MAGLFRTRTKKKNSSELAVGFLSKRVQSGCKKQKRDERTFSSTSPNFSTSPRLLSHRLPQSAKLPLTNSPFPPSPSSSRSLSNKDSLASAIFAAVAARAAEERALRRARRAGGTAGGREGSGGGGVGAAGGTEGWGGGLDVDARDFRGAAGCKRGRKQERYTNQPVALLGYPLTKTLRKPACGGRGGGG